MCKGGAEGSFLPPGGGEPAELAHGLGLAGARGKMADAAPPRELEETCAGARSFLGFSLCRSPEARNKPGSGGGSREGGFPSVLFAKFIAAIYSHPLDAPASALRAPGSRLSALFYSGSGACARARIRFVFFRRRVFSFSRAGCCRCRGKSDCWEMIAREGTLSSFFLFLLLFVFCSSSSSSSSTSECEGKWARFAVLREPSLDSYRLGKIGR